MGHHEFTETTQSAGSIDDKLSGWKEDMVTFLGDIIRFPAMSPLNGGDGELRKITHIESILDGWGMKDRERIDAPDPDVPSGIRPSLVIWRRGRSSHRRVIIVAHSDVVPIVDHDAWLSPPFEPRFDRESGILYGRGVEDNGQSLAASVFALRALHELDITPFYDVGVVLAADEETHSVKGINYIGEQGFFRPTDMVIVPDCGNAEGTMVEVAEKSAMWLKITTTGTQGHASRPDLQVNAHRAAMRLISRLDAELPAHYDARDEVFDLPISTFEPTKREANVPNVNTIPGVDIAYFDCRILPQYDLEEIMDYIRSIADEVSSETGASFDFSGTDMTQAAPPTDPEADIVRALLPAVREVYDVEPTPIGIGGGTCAACVRRLGIPAAVWMKATGTGHQPNEHIHVDNLLGDSRVFARVMVRPVDE